MQRVHSFLSVRDAVHVRAVSRSLRTICDCPGVAAEFWLRSLLRYSQDASLQSHDTTRLILARLTHDLASRLRVRVKKGKPEGKSSADSVSVSDLAHAAVHTSTLGSASCVGVSGSLDASQQAFTLGSVNVLNPENGSENRTLSSASSVSVSDPTADILLPVKRKRETDTHMDDSPEKKKKQHTAEPTTVKDTFNNDDDKNPYGPLQLDHVCVHGIRAKHPFDLPGVSVPCLRHWTILLLMARVLTPAQLEQAVARHQAATRFDVRCVGCRRPVHCTQPRRVCYVFWCSVLCGF